MFSQQGMFFIGGSLADRFGKRPIILLGIAVRVVGFLMLGLAESMSAVIVGVLLVGFAAALFAPAVESANAEYGRELESAGVMRRTDLFAVEQMCSRLGTVIGPALGAALLMFPFSWTRRAPRCSSRSCGSGSSSGSPDRAMPTTARCRPIRCATSGEVS